MRGSSSKASLKDEGAPPGPSIYEHESLKHQLEDAQASLAAALARIEGYRMKERVLMAELASLRKAVHGGQQSGGGAKSGAAGDDGPGPSSPSGRGPREAPFQVPSKPASQKGSSVHLAALDSAGPSAAWGDSVKTYVQDCNGEFPVTVITGSKKIPANLIVTKDTVEFVEVMARITSSDFVGVSTMKTNLTVQPAVTASTQPATSTPAAPPKPAKAGFLCFGAPPALSDGGGDGGGALAQAQMDAEARGSQAGTGTSAGGAGSWQILWGRSGQPQRLAFEASQSVRDSIHRHTEKWLGISSETELPGADGGGNGGEEAELATPKCMPIGDLTMTLLGEPSAILSQDHIRALAGVIPPLERLRDWVLAYSTARHGISLQTLYRKAGPQHGVPTLLVVRDFGGYVFGAYTADSWRIAPRFYGSGETFVFQLEPYRVMYPWRSMSKAKNDFFMYGTPECLAVGGLGHFAIWLDSELLQGSSGTCGTFGSPCLAHRDEFKIQSVEVWHAQM